MRNPDTIGGSRVIRVEEPYVNGRPGAVLAERNWKGEPVSRGGIEGGDLEALALEQLAIDQAPPQTDFSAQDAPNGTVYTRRPFQAMTGRTNFTPYGTISSRPKNEEERVAREWHENVVAPTQGGTINGQPASSFRGPAVITVPPQEPEVIVEQATPAEIARQNAQVARETVMTPGTRENTAWQNAENRRRAQANLGPLDTAYEDFVADREFEAQEDALSRDLYNAARRAERQTRTEQGRRTRSGEMVPTRSSSISPDYAPVLKNEARALARQILSGASPEDVSRGWQNISRSAVAGAPVPMSPEERYQEQQSRESSARLRMGQQANQRAQTQYEQEQADRQQVQSDLLKWNNATTEAERNQIIRQSPALQNYLNIRPVRPQEDVTQREAEFANEMVKGMLKDRDESTLSDEERQQLSTYRGTIARYANNQANRFGINTASKPAEKQKLTREQAQDFLKQAGGDKQKARALATEAGYSF